MKYKICSILCSLSLALSFGSAFALSSGKKEINSKPTQKETSRLAETPKLEETPKKDAKNLSINSKPSPSEQEKNMNIAEKNLSDGNQFLEENKRKSGVITLPSGLQYKIEKEGQGNPPGPTDFVTVHYRGTLPNGSEFDSSYSRHEPTTFAVNAVIPGWTEALQLMKPGSKWKVFVPPQLGYGERTVSRQIGPNSTLIFDIELISVKPSFDENRDGNVDEWEDMD